MVSLWGRTDVVVEVIRATHEAVLANLWPCGTRVKFVGNFPGSAAVSEPHGFQGHGQSAPARLSGGQHGRCFVSSSL